MKRVHALILTTLLSLTATFAVLAQPPRPGGPEGPGGPGRPGGPGGPAGKMFRLPPSPIMLALDTDGDGELSAKEIENATASLKTLDKDKNGKLTENELRPSFDRGEGPGMGGEAIITQLMVFDKNSDGKLSKAEIPQRLQGLLERADTNKDGVLDRDELTKLARQRSAGGGGGGPGPRSKFDGERPPPPEGERHEPSSDDY